MKIKYYLKNEQLITGITLKDTSELEDNNMALHVCINIKDVIDNRKQLAASLDCEVESFVCANQTHSENFHKVTAIDLGCGATTSNTAIPNTDALYTFEPNIVLCSFTADCVPVIFYHKSTNCIGVIHSGWQGTVKEITLKTFEQLIQKEQCHPDDFYVQIGPALSQQKFEVDEDVFLQFKQLGYADDFIYFNEQTNKYHIDNQKTVKKQCELAGIPSDHISIDTTCTFLSSDGFSYRQNKQCGRHLSFIVRKQ